MPEIEKNKTVLKIKFDEQSYYAVINKLEKLLQQDCYMGKIHLGEHKHRVLQRLTKGAY